MVLEKTYERRILHVKLDPKSMSDDGAQSDLCCYYTDINLGLFLVRGDSMVLLGEVDDDDNQTDRTQDDINVEKMSAESDQMDFMGSGLLSGGFGVDKQASRMMDAKKMMKKVSLQEFETLEKKEKAKDKNDQIEPLSWEFDLDLVV